MTSHAAVVARGMGKCCVAGAGDVRVNEEENYFEVKGVRYRKEVLFPLTARPATFTMALFRLFRPAFPAICYPYDLGRQKPLALYQNNADTPKDAKVAVGFGAEGIGLCRTEHMFFEADRIKAVREMILSDSEEERRKALAKILPYQRQDFVGIFKEMGERPVTIRYLDPPLHEFLPHTDEEMVELAKEMGPFKRLKIPFRLCMNSTLCWVIADAGCRLPIRKLPKCKPEP